MEFPSAEQIRTVLDDVSFPRLVDVRYDPPTPELEDVESTTRAEIGVLPLADLPEGATVAVGLGSRGITSIVPVARTVIAELVDRGFDPVVVPAMGSHGGATPEGQVRTLAALGLTEEELGCPVDARMETVEVGESGTGPVRIARSAFEADGVLVVNRVKAHTNYTGSVESGLCKMLVIGLGKQRGARAIHEQALARGYEAAITGALEVLREEVPLLGGIAVVENFYDRTAEITGIDAADLPAAETPLLERAYDYMPTLPYDEIDVLVVDRIGKDVSGTGMDTNVIGRYRVLNADDPETPAIKRVLVRGLTEATHGNAQGLGLADLTTRSVADEMDLSQMYANALTSNSLSKAAIPVVLPDDELALTAAVSTVGPYDPETIRLVWIRDTGHLSEFRVSPALADEAVDHVEVVGESRLTFDDGEARFERE